MVIGLVVVTRKWKNVLEVGLIEPYYEMMSKPGFNSSLIKGGWYLVVGEECCLFKVATVEVTTEGHIDIRYCELELFVPIHGL